MNDLFQDKLKVTVDRIRQFEPPYEGYYLAFSGGKDSVVLKKLAEMSGVRFDAYYSVTTIDPPELVQFIRKYHPDVIFERPERPLLSLVPTKGFPLRQFRWCCQSYKEKDGSGRFLLTGIRAEESYGRSRRKMVEICYRDKTKRFLHPIIDWDEQEIWEFIKRYKLPYCKLYDEGFTRIGCVLCPMQTVAEKLRDIKRFPIMAANWQKSFEKLYEARKKSGAKSVDRWKNSKEMFDWWISNKGTPKKDNNMMMFL